MKKIKFLTITIAILSAISCFPSFAQKWHQTDKGWWLEFDDGTYPTDTWVWADGNGDWLHECYYFDENGYTKPNSTIWNGYQTDATGAWCVNGVTQQQVPMKGTIAKINNKKVSEEKKSTYGFNHVYTDTISKMDDRMLVNPIPITIYYNDNYRDTNSYLEKDNDIPGFLIKTTSLYKNNEGDLILGCEDISSIGISIDGYVRTYYSNGEIYKKRISIFGQGEELHISFDKNTLNQNNQFPEKVELFILSDTNYAE